ncbi:longitudinals lacking protein, isoforms A/B/D/L-like isoform X6 [Diorhabda sublineata]|uniref:longitudinals lacking protein, isoforms A/B/D/L-like isoform X6 n=1 Tax=Diorhabda sublineata TaxID=1163346 RepID=UPI0024E0982F|nr:longitudinals lacking protein, isoforms A/B/D/L-like isoform X6 [Diorhabda sublineata]
MDDDQQFCLRWNNHQSTLVAVFDTLLENGTLVDCTLAAEGKCLNAHKVVLSACSPYFEALLSKHFDKHPILILKDVKFQELKAMMDYMYRGEVNISQDQLGALLKAAESLQIKGLSDNRKGETSDRKPTPAAPPPKSPQPASTLPKVQGLTIEQRAREDSREGSMSPGPRKKKRLRRKSEELDNHDASNSSESHSLPAQSIPMLPAITKMNADVPDQVETKSEILTRHKQIEDTIPQVPIIKEKIETHTELMLEPKSEYVDEMNEDSIEDLTLDDDDLSNMEQVDDQAGPSHGAGEGSSQGFGGWHMGNQSQDEVFLAAQEAVGAHRDSQAEDLRVKKPGWEDWPSHLVLPMMIMRENMTQSMLQTLNRNTLDLSLNSKPKNRPSIVSTVGGFVCGDCGRTYKLKSSLRNHQKWECGKEPQFKCPFCVYKAKQKMHMARHMERMHRDVDYAAVKTEIKSENDNPSNSDTVGESRMEISNDSKSCSNM